MGSDLKTLIAIALLAAGPLISLLITVMPAAWKQRIWQQLRAWLARLSRSKKAPPAKVAAAAKSKPAGKPKPKRTPAANPVPLPQQKPARSIRRRRLPDVPDDMDSGQLERRLATVLDQSITLAYQARTSPVTTRFSRTLELDVVRNARLLLAELRASAERPSPEQLDSTKKLERLFADIRDLISERRQPENRAELDDADALAIGCYRSLVSFASANQLGLTKAQPVTRLAPYDPRMASSFRPTGLALLNLPEGFFDRVVCWPALVHELGHHFLMASPGLDAQLRAQLDLPPELVGLQRMLPGFDGSGFRLDDLPRVLGGWFEELFADVFGVLMLGPAYVISMMQLFATPENRMMIMSVDAERRRPVYDHHPPRHLRFAMATRLIELAGLGKEAASLRREWARMHGGVPKVFLLPTATRKMELPTAELLKVAGKLVGRLYRQPLRALSGYRLAELPGLNFGLRENAAANRIRSDLRNGRVPLTSHAREIIAGAVLAVREEPAREAELMELARLAIRGIRVVFDDAGDAYDIGRFEVEAAANADELREAFLLHVILSPAPALQRLGLASREHFLGLPAAHAPARASDEPRETKGNGHTR